MRSFLRSRGIELPEGGPEDGPEAPTVVGLGNRKDAYFAERLHADGVEVFGGTVERVREVCSLGASTALVTSSKHGREVIALAGLGDIFDARLDGNDIETLGLKGKPNPDLFLEAASRLDVRPARAAVVEDALSGVQAGRAGGFGLVIGVNRGANREALERSGADVVNAALADAPRLRKHHGKMVFEIRPRIDWDKGRAVLWLLEALGLEGEEVLPLYLGRRRDRRGRLPRPGRPRRRCARRGGAARLGGGLPAAGPGRGAGVPRGARLASGGGPRMTQSSDWLLVYDGFDPEQEGRREALCVLGNGVFVTRGAAEESQADGVHYPGTYVAGGYNRLVTEIAGRPIVNEDLVNFPNWLPLTFRPEGGAWFAPGAGELLSYRQVLDMREGVLIRELRVRDDAGRETRVRSRRIVHMEQPNLAAIEYSITPENWAGRVEVRSLLDGSVVNAGVPRYRDLASKHLEIVDMGDEGSGVWLSRAPCSRGSRSASRRARAPGAATRRSTSSGASWRSPSASARS